MGSLQATARSSVKSTERRCTECGRICEKFSRTRHGRSFCNTCYTRQFKRRACPKCAGLARLPVDEPDALCRRCEREKPCARCGRSGRPIGKLTRYGPVCNSCASWFRHAEPCASCGRRARRLVGVPGHPELGRMCESCARSDHRACHACGRYRRVIEQAGGRWLCRLCLRDGEKTCPKCSRAMPAGYGRTCADCYWIDLFQRRLRVSLNALGSSSITEAFSQFAYWLLDEIGSHRAALSLNNHLAFFIELDRRWGIFPSHEQLIAHFGTPRLRRQRLVDRWMTQHGWIEPAQQAREEDIEWRRIRKMLDRIAEHPVHERLLVGYHDLLLNRMKEGRLSVRSIRMNLRSACGLLATTEHDSRPNQRALNAFLDTMPGQRASISGFLGYLRNEHCIDLIPHQPDQRTWAADKAKERERRLVRLLDNDKPASSDHWIRASLALFHGIPDRVLKRGTFELVSRDAEFWLIRSGQLDYWIPAPPDNQRHEGLDRTNRR